METIFFDIGIIFIIATIFAFIAKKLRQPKIPFYVLAGMVIGPFGYKLAEKVGLISVLITTTGIDMGNFFIHDPTIIKILAEIGIAFLLFVVGLELNIKRLKDVGTVATIGGSMKVIILFSLGSIIAMKMGFQQIPSIYIGLILAFSSTVVVIKLLIDNRELNTLHGRIIIGILLIEDLFAVLVLSALTTIDSLTIGFVILSILKVAGVLLLAMILSKKVLPSLFRFAARSNELLFLASLATCFIFSLLLLKLGFSIAIGAFIAGLALANLPYNVEMVGRVKSIRDFFSTLFFVSLGMELYMVPMEGIIKPTIIFLLFVLILKPTIVMAICSLFGYTKNTSFLSSISLAQISEFSLIILSQGLILGHISQEIFSIGIIIGIVTMTSTSYLVQYNHKIFDKTSKSLKIFDILRGKKKELELLQEGKNYGVILVGLNTIGYSIIRSLSKLKRKVLVVDYNPEAIKHLIKKKQPCIYGDIGDPETMKRLDFKQAKMVISTVSTTDYNEYLLKKIREKNAKAIIFVTAEKVDHALRLYGLGADYVILPQLLGGEYTSMLLEEVTDNFDNLIVAKLKHIEELKHRRKINYTHGINQ